MDAQRFLNFVECHAGCCYLFDPKQALQFKQNELLGLIRLNRCIKPMIQEHSFIEYWKYLIKCGLSKLVLAFSFSHFQVQGLFGPRT